MANTPKKGQKGWQSEFEYCEETAKWVEDSVRHGLKVKLIANCLGMTDRHLYNLYGQNIAKAKAEAANAVGERIYKEAKSAEGDPKLATFYAKSQLEWVEKETIDLKLDEDDKGDVNTSAIESLVAIVESKKRKSDG